jgi:hypothetical protein
MSVSYSITANGYRFEVLSGFGPDGIIINHENSQFDNPEWVKGLRLVVENYKYLYARDSLEHMLHTRSQIRNLSGDYLGSLIEDANTAIEGSQRGILTIGAEIQDFIDAILERAEQVERKEKARVEKEARAKLPDPGYVYVLKSQSGAYKIGRSKNPEDRVRTFGVKLPFQIEFELLIRSEYHRKLERDLHKRFADKRLEGEWFQLSPEDIEALRAEYGDE